MPPHRRPKAAGEATVKALRKEAARLQKKAREVESESLLARQAYEEAGALLMDASERVTKPELLEVGRG